MADLTNTIIDGDPFSVGEGGGGSGVGHEYDLVQNNAHDETTLTEDGVGKTTLPLVATFVGTQADWNNLSASEQAKYRILHIIGVGTFERNENTGVLSEIIKKHDYDLEASANKDQAILTEDSVQKTTLPLVSTFVGTQAEWAALSASEQALFRIVNITDDSGQATTSNTEVDFVSSDTTDANANSWTSVTQLTTGLSLSTLFARVSQMFKNVRFLHNKVQYLGNVYEQNLSNLSFTNNVQKGIQHTIQNVPAGIYLVFYQVGNKDNNSFTFFNYTDVYGYLTGGWSDSLKAYSATVTHSGGTFTRTSNWKQTAGSNLTKAYIKITLVKVG